MAVKDVITGNWASRQFERGGIDYVTSTIKLDGYRSFSETRRANSIWGDIENVRRVAKGHTKADIYDGRFKIATAKLHRKFDFFGDYGSYLDGRLKLDARSEKLTMWDSDLASNHWVAKIAYVDLF
jgi:hypothetical protein